MKPHILSQTRKAVETHRGISTTSAEHVGSRLIPCVGGWLVPPPALIRVEWPGGWQFVEVIE